MGELIDARTAADRLRVDVRTLYAYVSRGSLRRVPAEDGRRSRYDADEVELLAQRSRPRTLPRRAASVDVVVGTRVSTVEDGSIRYRGVDAITLAERGTGFEEVIDLLWSDQPVSKPDDWLLSRRERGAIHRAVAALPKTSPPLYRLATALFVMADPVDGPAGISAATTPAGGLPGEGLAAGVQPAVGLHAVPSWSVAGGRLVAAMVEATGGPAQPRSSVASTTTATATVAERLWSRLSPLRARPARIAALDRALVLLAEHELAASTLAVRVAASARATPTGCLLAGLAALDSALHGHVAGSVHRTMLQQGRQGEAPIDGAVVAAAGHSVHRHGDPRAEPLLAAVLATATPADRAMVEALRDGIQRLHPRRAAVNIDFALGTLTYVSRMEPSASESIFAIARTAGWLAHAAEEYDELPLRFRGRAMTRSP